MTGYDFFFSASESWFHFDFLGGPGVRGPEAGYQGNDMITDK